MSNTTDAELDEILLRLYRAARLRNSIIPPEEHYEEAKTKLLALIAKREQVAETRGQVEEARQNYIHAGFDIYNTSAEFANGVDATKNAHNRRVEHRIAELEAELSRLSVEEEKHGRNG